MNLLLFFNDAQNTSGFNARLSFPAVIYPAACFAEVQHF